MSHNFEQLAQGRTPDIDGVSSSWTFDAKTHASVCGGTFRRWRLYDGQFLTTEYVSTDGSRRSSSAKAMWDWTATHMQQFSVDDGSAVVTYPPLDDRWALLIAASRGWANYRFQADVFAMYQILRQHGYDDDHIVLICEGLPGMLLITAANPYKTSHADVWSEQVGVYLSNGFTRGFQEAVATNPAISLRDLYYTLAASTSGSHVKVYNVPPLRQRL